MLSVTAVPVAPANADGYSIWVGLVYVFNLMVGTGALALPAALAAAGWAYGSVVLVALALASFLAATYVLESHAAVNALRTHAQTGALSECEEESEREERYGEGEEPLVSRAAPALSTAPSPAHFSLDRRVELCEMAQVLLGGTERVLLYITLCLYLYGDLSIYSATVATSLTDVLCTHRPADWSNTSLPLPGDAPCRDEVTWPATRASCYRAALLSFTAALAPFSLFNLQKTKYLQIFTSVMRWLAFSVMISLAAASLARHGARGHPPPAAPAATPALFGTCVYAFMCHHSLPGLVSPVRCKRRLRTLLAVDYALVAAFYLLLALTGAFAFRRLQPLYSLNFVEDGGGGVVDYLLALFPVLTLSASYPVVAVTLRSNLEGAWCGLRGAGGVGTGGGGGAGGGARRVAFAALALAPPTLLTLAVADVGVLVSATGALAGAGVQYAAPALLVRAARRRTAARTAPAPRTAGPLLLLAWAAASVLLLLAHYLQTHYR